MLFQQFVEYVGGQNKDTGAATATVTATQAARSLVRILTYICIECGLFTNLRPNLSHNI